MYKSFLHIALIILLISSCIKEDSIEVSDNYILNSTLSFPIRDIDLGTDDYISSSAFYEFYKLNDYVLISKYAEFDFSSLVDDPKNIKSLLYRFSFDNKFPARLEIETYFVDESGNIIGTDDNTVNIDAASTDSNGEIRLNQEQTFDIKIDENNRNIIDQVHSVLLRVFLLDLDENIEVINKLDNYNILISVGIRAEIALPTKV